MHHFLHVSLFFFLLLHTLYAKNDRSLQLKQMQNESRHALVIGNGNYQSLSNLKNPINDAKAIRDALKLRGFDVMYLENATHKNFEKQIKKFGTRLKNAGVGLFYYAGHGIEVEGKNYLVATDSDISEEDEVKYETVALNWIIDKMKHAHPRVNIIILDACRNDPFSRSGGGGLATPPTARGMFIAYATEAGKVAADGKGQHGVFTKYLIRNLNKPIDIDTVFNQTQRDVLEATDNKQFPTVFDKFVGSFFFTLPNNKNKIITPKRKSNYSFTSQKPQSYTLTINPTPYDARVQITNIKPRYYQNIPLQPGKYTIKVSKEGYLSKTGTVELYNNLNIDIVLEKKVQSSFVTTAQKKSYPINNSFRDTPKQKSIPGVFIDTYTGLMWQDNRDAKTIKKTWNNAKSYCSALSLAGYNDWYLPIKSQIKNIQNSFNYDSFSYYWSSTSFAGFTSRAWTVSSYNANSNGSYKADYYYVRCVRGGR